MNRTSDKESLLKLGLHIKQLRLDKKMSQEALAYAANVSLSQVSRIELGKHNTTFLTLTSICKALNISINHFFFGFDSSSTSQEKKNKLSLHVDLLN